ncbi:hypothetical protein ACF2G4_20195 (plasmid) [Pantoea sp. C3]|uniref:hypothetical protein n=1 Tax=Pantoea phytostimulans TaxID=2769024 RepID=UPI0038F7375F
MVNKERTHDNTAVQAALRNLSTVGALSDEAKTVLRNLIQNATYLGKNRVDESDVYAIVRNSDEISLEETRRCLYVARGGLESNTPSSRSSIEKYKRIALEVSTGFQELIASGTPMSFTAKLKPKHHMNEEQKLMMVELINAGTATQELIDLLAEMKKGK